MTDDNGLLCFCGHHVWLHRQRNLSYKQLKNNDTRVVSDVICFGRPEKGINCTCICFTPTSLYPQNLLAAGIVPSCLENFLNEY